ncbi:MAG: DNA-directed RNA polymerase subunit H [Candidatus Woesearchaeota archaeon]|nr:MAG: DNA-directed RNA polymerase subunit H [Candidatus Woesearchaeota archaeon]
MGKGLDLQKHDLVPLHKKLTPEEAKNFLKEYNVSPQQLPKLFSGDPIAKQMGFKAGDIVKIERESKTGKNVYYRLVINHA